MIRDRFHRHAETDRATELDPSTFDHAEDWQRQEDRGMDWLVITVWGGLFALGLAFWGAVLWGVMMYF